MSQTNPENSCACASVPTDAKTLVDLNTVFSARFRASLVRITEKEILEFILQSKACEMMASFKEMQASIEKHPEATSEISDAITEGLYFLLSVITANLDLVSLAAHIKPCGIPGCECHGPRMMVIRCLQMLKDGMKAQHDRLNALEKTQP